MIHEASLKGFNTDLYKKDNEGLIISDFDAKARELFEKEIILRALY